MTSRKSGIALIITVGILTLLSLTAIGMVRLAVNLRARASVAVDAVQARLLARSGVEYGSARLVQDSFPKSPATQENQSEDWTYRDGWDIPLERSLNPSYAQTEPYQDVAANGKYDAGADPYSERNGNARFDAWSGRLRNRHGMTGGTFALKVSEEGGRINVNAGWLGLTDYDGNGMLDYRDSRPNLYGQLVSSNITVAFILNELALGLEGETGARFARWQLQQSAGVNLGVAAPGALIIGNRPPGGYRDLEEMAHLFDPPYWQALRPHLSVAGRMNRYGCHPRTPQRPYHPVGELSLDRQQLLDVRGASVQVLAAMFTRLQFRSGQLTNVEETWSTSPEDGTRVARFLKGFQYRSRYDLFLKLCANAHALFPDDRTFPTDTDKGDTLAAETSEAAANQQTFNSRSVYSLGTSWPGRIKRDGLQRRPPWNSLRDGFSYNDQICLYPGPALDWTPSSLFSIESLGKVSGTDSLSALGRARSILRLRGLLESDSQEDFENVHFNPAIHGYSDIGAFEGGIVPGRPVRDRATTFPRFSRDAIPDLMREWPNRVVYLPETPGLTQYPLELVNDSDNGRFYGEVGLLDHSWIDPWWEGDARGVFYQPVWDRDQPERVNVDPKTGLSDPGRLTWQRNFDDFEGGAKGYVLEINEENARIAFLGDLIGNGIAATVGRPSFGFSWGAGGVNPGNLPAAIGNGVLDRWTVEHWSEVRDHAYDVKAGNGKMGMVTVGDAQGQWWTQKTAGDNKAGESWSPLDDTTHHGGGDMTSWVYRDDTMTCYVNAVPQGNAHYEPMAVDPASTQEIRVFMADECRIYRDALERPEIEAHAFRGRLWTADPLSDPPVVGGYDLRAIPSFISPLYRFNSPAQLTEAQWDGYVPQALTDATDAWNKDHPEEPKVPLRVELWLHRDARETIRVELPADSWRTGGTRIDLGQSGVDATLKWNALHFKVWLDASALDQAYETPVFDGLRIGFKCRILQGLREE